MVSYVKFFEVWPRIGNTSGLDTNFWASSGYQVYLEKEIVNKVNSVENFPCRFQKALLNKNDSIQNFPFLFCKQILNTINLIQIFLFFSKRKFRTKSILVRFFFQKELLNETDCIQNLLFFSRRKCWTKSFVQKSELCLLFSSRKFWIHTCLMRFFDINETGYYVFKSTCMYTCHICNFMHSLKVKQKTICYTLKIQNKTCKGLSFRKTCFSLSLLSYLRSCNF